MTDRFKLPFGKGAKVSVGIMENLCAETASPHSGATTRSCARDASTRKAAISSRITMRILRRFGYRASIVRELL